MEEEFIKAGLCREDLLSQSKWFVGVYQIAIRLM